MEQVQQNLEHLHHEMEHRTNLLGTGLTTIACCRFKAADGEMQNRR